GRLGGQTQTAVLASARPAVTPKASRPAAIIESRFMIFPPPPNPRADPLKSLHRYGHPRPVHKDSTARVCLCHARPGNKARPSGFARCARPASGAVELRNFVTGHGRVPVASVVPTWPFHPASSPPYS